MFKRIVAWVLVMITAFTMLSVTGTKVSADDRLDGKGGKVPITKKQIDKGRAFNFYPDESGYYLIYSEDVNGCIAYLAEILDSKNQNVHFICEGEDERDFYTIVWLNKGEHYWLIPGYLYGKEEAGYTFCMSKYDVVYDGVMTGSGGSVRLSGDGDDNYDNEYYEFTPDKSGYYLAFCHDPVGMRWPFISRYSKENGEITKISGHTNTTRLLSYYSLLKLEGGKTYKLFFGGEFFHKDYSFTLEIIPYDASFVDVKSEYYLVDPGQKITFNDDSVGGNNLPSSSKNRLAYSFIEVVAGSWSDIESWSGKYSPFEPITDLESGFALDNGVERYTLVRSELPLGGGEHPFTKIYTIFVMGDSVDGTLTPGQPLELNIQNEMKYIAKRIKDGNVTYSTDNEIRQLIYSYTPEKSGTITMTSADIVKGYPTIALFDQDYNFINSAGGDEYFDENRELIQPKELENGQLDLKSVTLEAHLEAGKTYYFAIPVYNFGLVWFSDFDIPKDTFLAQYKWNIGFKEDSSSDTGSPSSTDSKPDSGSSSSSTPSNTPSNSSTPSLPSTSEQGLSFGDFVERLYVVALNRQSEPEGKAFWCEHVGNGDLNGAQCANEFLLSKEFNDRNLSDEQFLTVLYKTFFDRDAKDDPDGFNFWMNSLKTEGRDKVVDGFINSTEWCNICASYGVKSGATRAKATVASANATAFATRLYTECLGREPEAEGLKFWSLGLTNLELSGTQATREFFYSPEFVNANYSNEEYINRMYKTFMGRDPEPEGKAYWLDLLSKGTSRDEVFNYFSTCKEFTEICQSYAITR